MEKKKKTWTEPKLTALVRRKPEEGILSVCKTDGGQVGPLFFYARGCYDSQGWGCVGCSEVGET